MLLLLVLKQYILQPLIYEYSYNNTLTVSNGPVKNKLILKLF